MTDPATFHTWIRRSPPPRPSLRERFLAKVTKTDGCWLWTAAKNPKGYGVFRVEGRRNVLAHRLSYELHVGPVPDGLEIDHLCRNPSCVNPDHLEAVTSGENTRRGFAARAPRTHCSRGHEFTPDNVEHVPRGRRCKRCQRGHQRAYKLRQREAVPA